MAQQERKKSQHQVERQLLERELSSYKDKVLQLLLQGILKL